MNHDNYPPGAAGDPNAPWNQDEDTYHDIMEEVKTELAEQLPDVVFDIIREFADADTAMDIYDELQPMLYKLWEE